MAVAARPVARGDIATYYRATASLDPDKQADVLARVSGVVESLSAELKHQGINVNCVLPGTIDTPQNRESMPKADHSRWVPPEAIADVILFLASDAARAVTGAAIPVYGRS